MSRQKDKNNTKNLETKYEKSVVFSPIELTEVVFFEYEFVLLKHRGTLGWFRQIRKTILVYNNFNEENTMYIKTTLCKLLN